MPDLNDLIRTRGCLKRTKIKVCHEDGRVEEEQRTEDGDFAVLFEDDGRGNGANKFNPSKRMLRWAGMVIDYKPDLQLACVAEGVYLSSQDVAQDLNLMTANGITHIVNVATGVRCLFPQKFVYLALTALDVPTEKLKRHFRTAIEFMRKAVEKEMGKVHCNAGISRSTSLVLAYLMYYERKPLARALEHVRTQRPIARPNDGFMQQLKEFEGEIGLVPITDKPPILIK